MIRKCKSERVDVPWWDLIKIAEGQVNRGFYKILGMKNGEAWELRGDDKQKMLEKQKIKKETMYKRRYVKKQSKKYRMGDQVCTYRQEKIQRKSILFPKWIAPCKIVG